MSRARPLEIEMPLIVRTYDIDFGGVVSNIVYVRWLEDMRMALLAAYCPLNQTLESNVSPIVSATHIRYRRPLRLFDNPVGRMWVSKLERVRWTLDAEIVLNGDVMASATQYGGFVNLKTLRPTPVPQMLTEAHQRDS